MGKRNRDRYTVDDWREACPTVGSMRRARWLVLAVCPVCDLQIEADLKVIETIKGADFSLWGQTTPCRRRFCDGKARFFVQPPGASAEVLMTAPPRTRTRRPPL
jgi:hypothetical protein